MPTVILSAFRKVVVVAASDYINTEEKYKLSLVASSSPLVFLVSVSLVYFLVFSLFFCPPLLCYLSLQTLHLCNFSPPFCML